MNVCSVDKCDRTVTCRGWCSMHYQRWQRSGQTGSAVVRKSEAYRGPCSIEGCERPARAKTLCKMHHARLRKTGSTAKPAARRSKSARAKKPRPTLSLEERIAEFESGKRSRAPHGIPVDRYVRHHTEVGEYCWEWRGNKSHGYGKFALAGVNHYAHRVVFEMAHGSVPDGFTVDHMCRNRGCVNPSHLQAVTQKENNENHSNEGYGATGVRGVSFDKRRGKYEAYTTHMNRKISGGMFDSLPDAASAARALRFRYHTNNLADFEAVSRRSDVRRAA